MPDAIPAFAFAKLPAASANKYALVVVTDCDPPAPCLAWSNGKIWQRVTIGTTVTRSPPPPPVPTKAYSDDFTGEYQ